MTYMLKMFKFGTLSHESLPGHWVFGHYFCSGIRFFGEIVPSLDFALAAHLYLPGGPGH